MNQRAKQLYTLTSATFHAPFYVAADGRLQTRPANDIPLVSWPDRRWCPSANRFMRELFEKGLSRRNRGGTLSVYAAHISPLVRFCWKRRVEPIELTDALFTEFISDLMQATEDGARLRDANSVIAIGRSCLEFLRSEGRHHGDSNFVHENGRIRLQARRSPRPRRDAHDASRTLSLWHASFPTPDPVRRRRPVASQSVEAIRSAIHTASGTTHQKIRRYIMLKLLEMTGGRRGELTAIRTQDVLVAEGMPQPMLRMLTLKKRGGLASERLVPITRADTLALAEYVHVHRRSVIRRTVGTQRDHGWLLVSERDGGALRPNTITQELALLARSAGLNERVSPHMFRHRFITKLFVALIEQYESMDRDTFRQLLVSSHSLKQKVAEWTGHSRPESLDPYIHLAFDEISRFKVPHDIVRAGMALDSFAGTLAQTLDNIRAGDSPMLTAEQLLRYVEELRRDIATVAPRSGCR